MAVVTNEDREKLRMLLGESIPTGGTEDDTLFTDQQITDFLQSANVDAERAAYEAWRAKAAQLSGLVNVTEGAASREMQSLYENALEMVKLYARSSSGPTEGRARVGRIVRR